MRVEDPTYREPPTRAALIGAATELFADLSEANFRNGLLSFYSRARFAVGL